jgi:stearoyl-CoA 9-desaturase NADPH oxidoreductase
MRALRPTPRVLRWGVVDLLLGPHGVDRYLELVRPEMTVGDARARVLAVRHQTERSVTLSLGPNSAWSGFTAGQFLRVGVEIDGVRRTRTYSPACSERSPDGLLELTVTTHPNGLVSRYLRGEARPGTVLHLGEAQGDFVLPQPRPRRLALISGGSGITPVLSMLRTLIDEHHGGEIAFVHYARTAADWLYGAEVRDLAARHPHLSVDYVATREGGAHLSRQSLEALMGSLAGVHVAVCGPPNLIETVRGVWPERELVLSESFRPPAMKATAAAGGTLSFLHSGRSVPVGSGTLLEQAEAAGLTPEFGCRMGICHTCTCRKAAGAVQNLGSGEVSDQEDEDIQLCVSAPAGDVALEL